MATENNLIRYYKLNGNALNYLDNTSGAWTSESYATNHLGYLAGSFNTSSKIAIGSTESIRSITAWIRPAGSECAIYQGDIGSNFYMSGGAIGTSGVNTTQYVDGNLGSAVSPLNWHFVAFAGSVGMNNTNPTIGSTAYSGGLNMGELRLYRKELTGDEIHELFKKSYSKLKKADYPIDQLPDQADSSLKGGWLNKNSNINDYSTNNIAITFSGLDRFNKIGAKLTNGSINWATQTFDSYGYWFQSGAFNHYFNGSGINYINGASGNYTLPYTVSGTGLYNVSGTIKDLRIYTGSKTADWIKNEYLKGNPEDLAFNSSLNDLKDHSANKIVMSISGNATILNNGISFDGTNDYVSLADAVPIQFERTDKFSIGCWVKTTTAGVDRRFIHKAKASSPYTGIWFGQVTAGNAISLELYDAEGDYIGRKTTASINNNAWHHIGFTYDGTSANAGIKLYIDGVRRDTTDSSAGVFDSSILFSVNMTIGGNLLPEYFNGQISDVKIYNKELTALEIKQYYENTRSNY